MDASNPWKAWAAVFLLGSLGADASHDAIRAALERLPDDDEDHWSAAAEALALVVPPDVLAPGEALRSSASPAARAVGLDLLARRDALSADALRGHLLGQDAAVLAAAARAAVRTRTVRALAPELVACLASPSAAVAWEAARALTLAGMQDPYLDIRAGGRLASMLGARGVEILIMAGEDADLGAIETLLATTPMTAPLLSAVARFGSVNTWSFLLHYLTEPELADAAVQALRMLFGDLVPEAEAASYAAWKQAIVEAGFNPTLRYYGGKPWHPSTVLTECASGSLNRVDLEKRIDEVAARTGAEPVVDFAGWELDMRGAVAAFSKDAGARATRWRPGAWR